MLLTSPETCTWPTRIDRLSQLDQSGSRRVSTMGSSVVRDGEARRAQNGQQPTRAGESMVPTIEQAADRSGLSLRSLYRYFADPGELRATC